MGTEGMTRTRRGEKTDLQTDSRVREPRGSSEAETVVGCKRPGPLRL